MNSLLENIRTTPGRKNCGKCHETKPVDDFYKNSTGKGGYTRCCKDCTTILKPGTTHRICSSCRVNLPIAYFGKKRKGYDYRCKDCQIDYGYRRSFGITKADYDMMFEKQKGLCALCHEPSKTILSNGKVKRLSVDHDHSTGRVRGLLCKDCNLLLYHLGDNAKGVKKAMAEILEYLDEE